MSLRAARRRANRVQGPVAQNSGQRQLMRRNFSQVGRALVRQVRGEALSVLTSLMLVAVTNVGAFLFDRFFWQRHCAFRFSVPVLIAGAKFGILPPGPPPGGGVGGA